MPATPPIPSYSTAEVAQRLGVSAPTVQRWVDLGVLKAWKTVGGHRRIDAASVDEFMAAQRLPGAPPAPARRAFPMVLVVDDNPDDRDLLQALVEATLPGAIVRLADSGFEALVAIGRDAPDILCTDIVMPHMDGMEMLRHLASARTPGPRSIIVVTSLRDERLDALAELPLALQLLHKPIQPEAFAAALLACPSADPVG